MSRIEDAVASAMPAMVKGRSVVLPSSSEHPRDRPDLFRPVIGWPVGQGCDYAMPTPDGGRVHAQCIGGNVVIHLDKINPARGPGPALMHVLTEAPWLKAAVLIGLVYGGIRLARSSRSIHASP